MWEQGIAEDRRCPCGSEDSPDLWLQGCAYAAVAPRSGHFDRRPSWEEFRKAVQFKTRPCCAAGVGDYECFVQGSLVDVNEFWWDSDMPVFTDGPALHGLYPGLAVALIGAFQFGCNGVSKYIRIRLPREMRQLSGTTWR